MQRDCLPPLAPYHEWLRDSVGPTVQRWSPSSPSTILEDKARELRERTNDDESSQRYAAACPVEGASHRDYRLREVALDCGASVWAGIHFRGTRLDFPFVGVFAQTRWLEPEELPLAHRALEAEFSLFAPKASWWWTRPGRELSPVAGTSKDQHLVMGHLDEIRATPPPPLPEGWQLQPISSASDIAGDFQQMYRDFHQARPELAIAVPVSEMEEMEKCARDGGLFACFEDRRIAGLVAARVSHQRGARTWLIQDIVLARRHVGKGLAQAVERAALDRFDSTRTPLVTGTIDARNLPSLKTALGVGRQVVGAWVFVESTQDAEP